MTGSTDLAYSSPSLFAVHKGRTEEGEDQQVVKGQIFFSPYAPPQAILNPRDPIHAP